MYPFNIFDLNIVRLPVLSVSGSTQETWHLLKSQSVFPTSKTRNAGAHNKNDCNEGWTPFCTLAHCHGLPGRSADATCPPAAARCVCCEEVRPHRDFTGKIMMITNAPSDWASSSPLIQTQIRSLKKRARIPNVPKQTCRLCSDKNSCVF